MLSNYLILNEKQRHFFLTKKKTFQKLKKKKNLKVFNTNKKSNLNFNLLLKFLKYYKLLRNTIYVLKYKKPNCKTRK